MPFGTPPAHVRISMLGTIGASEIFSMNLAYRLNPGPVWEAFGGLEPNASVWDDMAMDCAQWFANGATRIHQEARLRTVKFASIGDDGLYDAPVIERSLGAPGGGITVGAAGGVPGNSSGPRPPNSQSLALTLHTAGDNQRIKGRIFLPIPELTVDSDGRISPSDADSIEGRFRTLIEDLNNEPGIDLLNGRVVVASGGRRNSDGSVKMGPSLQDVIGVSVGRVPDVQRRRRNKLSENRTLSAAISPP